MTAALRKIEAELRALADKADTEHPVDVHDLRIIVIKMDALAEQFEAGLFE